MLSHPGLCRDIVPPAVQFAPPWAFCRFPEENNVIIKIPVAAAIIWRGEQLRVDTYKDYNLNVLPNEL